MNRMMLTPSFIAGEITNLDFKEASDQEIAEIDTRFQQLLFGDYYLSRELIDLLDQAINDQQLDR